MTKPLSLAQQEAVKFGKDEDGTGTVFSIFAFAFLMIIGGIAVDGSNFWRSQQQLQATADVAAHAGVVEIARKNGSDAAKLAAANFVNANMPADVYGNLYADQTTDISVVHYDEATNTVSTDGRANAVQIFLHRNELSQNPVRTLALRVSDIFVISEQTYLSSWNVQVRGVAALAKFQGCNSTDGIYAQGQIRLSSSNTVGAGYCMHSQNEVWMSQQNTFVDTSAVSMPNLDSCGDKCTDAQNPGTSSASFERNLIMPDIPAHITEVRDSFLETGDTTMKDDFFQAKSLENSALQALRDIGITTSHLVRGSVVNLTEDEFESLTQVPEGLTYNVTCTANGNGPNTRLEFAAASSTTGGNGNGNTSTTTTTTTPSAINNVAIMTNCSLDFQTGAIVTSSVILSTRTASAATITASSGAYVGDPLGGCDVDEQSAIFGMGDMHVPADFAGSNVSITVDGDIHLSASSSSSTIDHSGVSFHASGQIDIASSHTFGACSNPPSGLVPLMQVIRHVIPFSGTQVASTN